jgi:hypothetical protein
MLDKNDLQAIRGIVKETVDDSVSTIVDKIVDKKIKEGFSDFYENILLPHLERSEKEHAEIKESIESIRDVLGNHEQRIRKIETVTAS